MSAGANSLNQICKGVEQFDHEALILSIKQNQTLCVWQSRWGKRLIKRVFDKGAELDILQDNADHWPNQVQELTHVVSDVDLLLMLIKSDRNEAGKVNLNICQIIRRATDSVECFWKLSVIAARFHVWAVLKVMTLWFRFHVESAPLALAVLQDWVKCTDCLMQELFECLIEGWGHGLCDCSHDMCVKQLTHVRIRIVSLKLRDLVLCKREKAFTGPSGERCNFWPTERGDLMTKWHWYVVNQVFTLNEGWNRAMLWGDQRHAVENDAEVCSFGLKSLQADTVAVDRIDQKQTSLWDCFRGWRSHLSGSEQRECDHMTQQRLLLWELKSERHEVVQVLL